MHDLRDSVNRLQKYIEQNNYKGYDPYDALKSPLFNLPVIKNSKKIRFLTQQLVKRLPINIRPLLLVPKGLNPVTLGLCIQGYTYQLNSVESNTDHIISKIDSLIYMLKDLIPKGFSRACWGYDFDWEARYAKIDAYQPTVVATGIIINALFEYYKVTGSNLAKDLIVSASNFVLKDLNKKVENNSVCFSYSPFDNQEVYNASMKGVRILSQAYSITGDSFLKENAQKGVNYLCENQNEDGSWFYSKSKTGNWVDNYHTGYILDCLDEYIKNTNDAIFTINLERGKQYYLDNFFEEDGFPKFYNNNKYPLDCTAASQSILTLTRFGKLDIAKQTALFFIDKMQGKSGCFYFRKFNNYTIKTSFMRWSQAWMFSSLSFLLFTEFQNK